MVGESCNRWRCAFSNSTLGDLVKSRRVSVVKSQSQREFQVVGSHFTVLRAKPIEKYRRTSPNFQYELGVT